MRSVIATSVDQKLSGLANCGAEFPVSERIRLREEGIVVSGQEREIDQANDESEDEYGR